MWEGHTWGAPACSRVVWGGGWGGGQGPPQPCAPQEGQGAQAGRCPHHQGQLTRSPAHLGGTLAADKLLWPPATTESGPVLSTHQTLPNWPTTPHTVCGPSGTLAFHRTPGGRGDAAGRVVSLSLPQARACTLGHRSLCETLSWPHFTDGKAGPQNPLRPEISAGGPVRVCPHTRSPPQEPTVHTTTDTWGVVPGTTAGPRRKGCASRGPLARDGTPPSAGPSEFGTHEAPPDPPPLATTPRESTHADTHTQRHAHGGTRSRAHPRPDVASTLPTTS